jgi:transcriptional regulator with XRE-family HTH domain
MPYEEANRLIDALKAWALERNLSQSEIAERLGVGRQRVSNWFAGKAKPSLEHGIRIQRLLKSRRKGK